MGGHAESQACAFHSDTFRLSSAGPMPWFATLAPQDKPHRRLNARPQTRLAFALMRSFSM